MKLSPMQWLRGSPSALLIATTLLFGCSQPHGFTIDSGPDGEGSAADASADSSMCNAGEWYCLGGGLRARRCDGRGGYSNEEDCQGAGLSCVPRIGCRVCRPGAQRCAADRPEQTQRCDDDGMSWHDGATCDGALGQSCSAGLCEDRCNAHDLSYLGCEYWAVTTVNSLLPMTFPFAVVVSNPQTYEVRVRITGGALTEPRDTTLAPGDVRSIELPWVQALSQNGRGGGVSGLATNGAYHVQANGPIAAYQFNPLRYLNDQQQFSRTNDASLLLPSRVNTQHYTVATQRNLFVGQAITGQETYWGGFVAIVGLDSGESGTRVTVRLTSPVSDPANPRVRIPAETRTFTLHQGDVLQLVGEGMGRDLTGTVIDSSAPVAVFVGHDCADIPEMRTYCDHLEEQLLPNETWGRRYAVTQLRDRGPGERSLVQIVSQRDDNALTFDGIETPPECASTLAAGRSCQFETSGSFQVSGTQPFLVMQYMFGQGPREPQCMDDLHPPDDPACWGDPAMVTEVPVDQFRHAYDFLVPDTYTHNFVNVVIPVGVTVRLDQSDVTGPLLPVGEGYAMYSFEIGSGRHHLEANGDGQRIAVKVYGVAPFTSYMYPGGLDLEHISPPG